MNAPPPDLQDEEACYTKLVQLLHPDGLACPRCKTSDGLGVHRRHRMPVLDYQCSACGRVFNAWTGTALQKTHRRPCQLLMILKGIAQGISTAELSRQLQCQRGQLLALRHRLQRKGWIKRVGQFLLDEKGEETPAQPPQGQPRSDAPHSFAAGLHARVADGVEGTAPTLLKDQ